MKKIISWNVASVRARMDILQDLLKAQNPDIVFLQEIKVEEEKFPFLELKAAGYNAYVSGQKSWNGVAILSKEPLMFRADSLAGFEDQARFVEAVDGNGVSYISVYVPNGQAPASNPADTSRLEYKLRWLEALYTHLSGLENFIIGGDFNVIQKDADVYNPALFKDSVLMLPVVRQAFEKLLSLNIQNPLRDLYPDGGLYTFWDFQGGALYKNHGIGLDYILLSQRGFAGLVRETSVLKEYRKAAKSSDHAPVMIQIEK